MNEKGDTRDDLRLPEGELGQKIREEYAKEDNTVIVRDIFRFCTNYLLCTRMLCHKYINYN